MSVRFSALHHVYRVAQKRVTGHVQSKRVKPSTGWCIATSLKRSRIFTVYLLKIYRWDSAVDGRILKIGPYLERRFGKDYGGTFVRGLRTNELFFSRHLVHKFQQQWPMRDHKCVHWVTWHVLCPQLSTVVLFNEITVKIASKRVVSVFQRLDCLAYLRHVMDDMKLVSR